MTLLPWPYWTGNPYLRLFCAELERRGVEVARGWPREWVARRLGAGDWIHFHWPGALLMSPSRARYQRRIDRFLARVDAARRRGVRTMWTAHNLWPHDDPHPDLGRLARKELLARVDHVLVHFEAAAPLVEAELGYRGPITVIPHGHYADVYPSPEPTDVARANLGLPAIGMVLLMLGRLRPYKGIGDAIRTFRRVAAPDDRLIVAGARDGDVSADLAAAAGDPRVILHAAHVRDADVARYHAAADGFVFAHRASFTSGTAVMAVSLGCPVVGPGGDHVASLGPEPRVFLRDSLEPAIEARRAYGPVDRAAIRAWAREHLSWSIVGERTMAALAG